MLQHHTPTPTYGLSPNTLNTLDVEDANPFVPAPTRDLRDKRARLKLFRSYRIGPVNYRKLVSQYGTAEDALEALPQRAESVGLKKYRVASDRIIDDEITLAQKIGARLLCLGDPLYPASLAQIANAPPVIWALGNFDCLAKPLISLVGTRNASSLGLRMARRLGNDLAERGAVTVSGLARGIDTAVHKASLECANGPGTIAVLAGGVDTIYPTENTQLAKAICESGLLLSEAPMGYSPSNRDFPKRNRIISGIGLATIVVEAALKSGSMLTAKAALDQGREVLAVPGHPLDGRAGGCNALIRDGAGTATNADDVFDALPVASAIQLPVEAEPSSLIVHHNLEAAVKAKLGPIPEPEADLMRALAVSSEELSRCLSILEVNGEVVRDRGGRVYLAT